MTKAGDFAKIELLSLRVVKSYLAPRDLKKALALVKEYKLDFERKWDEYFKR